MRFKRMKGTARHCRILTGEVRQLSDEQILSTVRVNACAYAGRADIILLSQKMKTYAPSERAGIILGSGTC